MNLTALNNIQPLEVNNSLINDSAAITTNLVSNANSTTDGYFGLGIMVVLFLFLLIITMSQQDTFRLDFLQAFILSSGVVTLVGVMGLLGNLFSSFQHVMWFALLFIGGIVANYLKNK